MRVVVGPAVVEGDRMLGILAFVITSASGTIAKSRRRSRSWRSKLVVETTMPACE